MSRVIYADQNVFLNGIHVLGAVGFQGQVQSAFENVSILGSGYVCQEKQGPQASSFEVSCLSTNAEDDVLQFLDKPVTGILNFENTVGVSGQWMGFNSRMEAYSFSCAVGQFPESKFGFTVLGKAGNSPNVSLNYNTGDYSSIVVVRPHDIKISGHDIFSGSFLQSATYTVDVPWKVENYLGSGFFSGQASVVEPMTITADFSLSLSELRDENLFSNSGICDIEEIDVFFSYDRCGQHVRTFKITGAKVQNVSIDASTKQKTTLDFSCATQVNSFQELRSILGL